MSVAQTVDQVLQQATFSSDDQPYVMVKLPPRAITAAAGVLAEIGEAFSALIVDANEVTLIIPADAADEFSRRLPDRQVSIEYRLITLDLPLEPTLVGLMARLSQALADAGVPVFPFAAFTRDHILVPAAQFDAAMSALSRLHAP